jgi:hypothetical protein
METRELYGEKGKKSVWDMNPAEFVNELDESFSTENKFIANNRAKYINNPRVTEAIDVFTGLTIPLAEVAKAQALTAPAKSWKKLSPEAIEALNRHIDSVIINLGKTNPFMAQVLELAQQELFGLSGSDPQRMHEVALKLENLSWESYKSGLPTLYFPLDNAWGKLLHPGDAHGADVWDARVILLIPPSDEDQKQLRDWTDKVANFYQSSFPNLDLESLNEIRLLIGENVAFAGTEIVSHTAGEALENVIMIDTESYYFEPSEKITEQEFKNLYLRLMIGHELAHKVQGLAVGTQHAELHEWMCDVLAWRMAANYIGQFDLEKQTELFKALDFQATKELEKHGIKRRDDPFVKSYRASDLWYFETRKDNPSLESWINRLDKAITTLWDSESEEAKLALELEEQDAKNKSVI